MLPWYSRPDWARRVRDEHAGRPAGGSGAGPDGVLVIQRRDSAAGAFAVAWLLTGPVYCNKFQ